MARLLANEALAHCQFTCLSAQQGENNENLEKVTTWEQFTFSKPDLAAFGQQSLPGRLALIPAFVFFLLFQKLLNEGLATTGLKG